jgi:hypothetical protein
MDLLAEGAGDQAARRMTASSARAGAASRRFVLDLVAGDEDVETITSGCQIVLRGRIRSDIISIWRSL